MKWFISVCLSIVILISALVVTINADVEKEITNEQKEYSQATIYGDFYDDRVNVVIFHKYSGLQKTFNNSDFPGIDIDHIEYITWFDTNNPEDYEMLDYDEFNQIICIYLSKTGKQQVVDAIHTLEENPIVLGADPTYHETGEHYTTPNDSYYADQNAVLQKISAPSAWDLCTGSTNVRVGVVDDSIYSHSDLNGNLADGANLYDSNNGTHNPCNSHGTAMAGIIGAKGNNSAGICGINWNVTIVPLTVTGDTITTNAVSPAAVISAIVYAEAQHLPVINISVDAKYDTLPLRTAIEQYKGLIVCAAGNMRENMDSEAGTKYYPGAYDYENILTVAAIGNDDNLLFTSNYGPQSVDLAAPGRSYKLLGINNTYETKALQTSGAAALVTGAAALLKAYNSTLNTYQIKRAIVDNTDYLSGLDGKCVSSGCLNIYAALNSVNTSPRVRNYKTIINLTVPNNISFKYGCVKLNFDDSLVKYYGFQNGNCIPEDETGVPINHSLERELTYFTYNVADNPIVNSGIFGYIKFNTPFKYENCTSSVSINSRIFTGSDGNSYRPAVSCSTVLMGDANSDNIIDTTDVNRVLQSTIGNVTLTSLQKIACDINEDGVVSSADSAKILQYINGNINTLW